LTLVRGEWSALYCSSFIPRESALVVCWLGSRASEDTVVTKTNIPVLAGNRILVIHSTASHITDCSILAHD